MGCREKNSRFLVQVDAEVGAMVNWWFLFTCSSIRVW